MQAMTHDTQEDLGSTLGQVVAKRTIFHADLRGNPACKGNGGIESLDT